MATVILTVWTILVSFASVILGVLIALPSYGFRVPGLILAGCGLILGGAAAVSAHQESARRMPSAPVEYPTMPSEMPSTGEENRPAGIPGSESFRPRKSA